MNSNVSRSPSREGATDALSVVAVVASGCCVEVVADVFSHDSGKVFGEVVVTFVVIWLVVLGVFSFWFSRILPQGQHFWVSHQEV